VSRSFYTLYQNMESFVLDIISLTDEFASILGVFISSSLPSFRHLPGKSRCIRLIIPRSHRKPRPRCRSLTSPCPQRTWPSWMPSPPQRWCRKLKAKNLGHTGCSFSAAFLLWRKKLDDFSKTSENHRKTSHPSLHRIIQSPN
jgi:hypothetical protein